MKAELSSSWEDAVPENEVDLIKRDVGRAVFFRYDQQDLPKPTTMKSITGSMDMMTLSNDLGQIDSSDESAQSSSVEVVCVDKGGGEMAEAQIRQSIEDQQKTILSSIIVKAIICKPNKKRLHYYQGLHDVASLFYLNYRNKRHLSSAILRKLAKGHLRDATQPDFTNVITLLEIVFFPMLQIINEEIHDFFVHRDLGPTVIMPWIITWFSHDIHDADNASRLFDAFLASHPLMPLYFSIALLVHPHNKLKLMDIDDDPAMLHVAINGLLRRVSNDFIEGQSILTFQDLIDDAISFMRRIPPNSLLDVATKYDELLKSDEIMAKADLVYFLKSSPKWSVQSTIPADWLLKKKEIESLQIKPSSIDYNCDNKTEKNLKQSKKISSLSNSKRGIISKKKKKEKNKDDFLHAKTAAGVASSSDNNNIFGGNTVMKSFFGMIGSLVFSINKKARMKRIS